MRLSALGPAVAALLLAACGEREERPAGAARDAPPKAAGAAVATTEVAIASFKFVPPVIRVAPGARITFTNRDKAPHTAETVKKSFDTGRLDLGEQGVVSVDGPGTYRYYCVYHRFMEATVLVTEES